jgi:hypothetical protein
MVILGGWVFLMSEVPLQANSTHPYDVWCVVVTSEEKADKLELPEAFGPGCREIRYRGTSRPHPPRVGLTGVPPS